MGKIKDKEVSMPILKINLSEGILQKEENKDRPQKKIKGAVRIEVREIQGMGKQKEEALTIPSLSQIKIPGRGS